MSEFEPGNQSEFRQLTTEEAAPEWLSRPMREIFWRKFRDGRNASYPSSDVHFSLNRESADTYPTTLEQFAGLVRRMYVSNDLRLRGTSQKFMDEAKQRGQLSTKTVSDWYESDVDRIATYQIPMSYSNLPNDEFLYRLVVTTLGSTHWGFRHGEDASLYDLGDQQVNLTEFLQAKIAASSRLTSPEQLPELVLFRADGRARGLQERALILDRYHDKQGVYGYLATPFYAETEFLNERLLPFQEIGYDGKNTNIGNDATYISVTYQSIDEIIGQLANEESGERRFFQRALEQTAAGEAPTQAMLGQAFRATVKYLLAERVAYQILRTVQAIS